MLKQALILVSIFAVVLLLALAYLTARYTDQAEIWRARQERLHMQAARDSILAAVAVRDAREQVLQREVQILRLETDELRAQVAGLEERRAAQQLSVRQLRTTDELESRLRETFPEVADSDWGVTEVYNEEAGLGIEYLLVPLWFSETFIIDHHNAENYAQQVDRLQWVDSLQTAVAALQDSLFILEQANKNAFRDGYFDAYARYDTLNQKYVALLQRPPVIKLPSRKVAVAAGVLGAAVGVGAAAALQR